MSRFQLDRKQDVSNVSGTGIVAEGILFTSGRVVLEWTVGDHRSVEVWPSIGDMIAVHGHSGLTVVKWVDQ
jgi:hypothetical protein